jgi:predicted RNase H-like nuclease
VLEEFYEKTRDFVSYVSTHPVLRNHQVDCMDALCLAVSGLLGLKNGFSSIPEVPEKDAKVLNMEIVYGKKESLLK